MYVLIHIELLHAHQIILSVHIISTHNKAIISLALSLVIRYNINEKPHGVGRQPGTHTHTYRRSHSLFTLMLN